MSADSEPTQRNDSADVAQRFRDVLERHGYPFQYGALRKLHDIADNPNILQDGIWVFDVAELPVSTRQFDTRIDFVLRHSQRQFYIAGECKRADPRFSDWCFVKAPYVRRGRSSERLFVDTVEVRFGLAGHEAIAYGTGLRYIDEHAYHLGFAVKNITEKGEATGNERKAIEDAAGQICKGLNGLVSIFGQHPPGQQHNGTLVIRIIAAIFTTARLFVSDVDLGAAELTTGKLTQALTIKQVPWLYLQYPMSPALKHDLPGNKQETSLAALLDPLYMRTIAIVSADGISDFFRRFDPFD